MAEDPRSRYLYNDRERAVILVNYKCGFTSVTSALQDSPAWKMDLKHPEPVAEAFAAGRFDGYDVHMVARDPVSRILSYYWNWLVEKDETFKGPYAGTNRHFRIFAEAAAAEEYRTFVDAGAEGRQTPEMFELWLRWLPSLWPADAHLWPQYLIYDQLGLERQHVHPWPISSLDALLASVGSPAKEHKNQTGASDRHELRTALFDEIVGAVYRRDFDELGPAFRGVEPAIARQSADDPGALNDEQKTQLATAARATPDIAERLIESVYRAILNPEDVAIDGGAHVGRHTFGLAAVCSKGDVLAVEALPHLAEQLQASAESQPNIVVRHCAIQHDDAKTETTFQFVEEAPARSGIVTSSINIADHLEFESTEIVVPTSTIDLEVTRAGISADRVKFVKLDLEGGEFHALLGARAVLAAGRPIVAYENNYFSPEIVGYQVEDVKAFFDELGYQRVNVFGELVDDDHSFWYLFAAPKEHAPVLANLLAALSTATLHRLARGEERS